MKKRFMVIFLATAVSALSFSISGTGVQDILERSQQRLEQEEGRREQQERMRREEEFSGGTDTPVLEVPPSDISEPKFLIREVRILDEKGILGRKDALRFIRRHTYTEMGASDIQGLLVEITNRLILRGYTTSSAAAGEGTDLSTGTLHIRIIPWTIQGIRINKGSILDRLRAYFMFPRGRGGVLSMRDMDQATDSFNSLGSSGMTMEIRAGTRPGQSVIQVRDKVRGKYTVSLTGNNHGEDEQSGMWRYGVGIGIDSPLGIGDSLSLSYSTVKDRKPDRGWKRKVEELGEGEILPIGPEGYDPSRGDELPYRRRLDMFTVGYTLRFREWTLRLGSSRSISEGSFHGSNTVYDMKSSSHTLSAGLDRVLYRDQGSKVSLGLGIRRKESETYLEGSPLSDRRLTIGHIGLSLQSVLMKGVLGATVGYEKGLRLFGAERDSGKHRLSPRAEGDKVTLDVSWYRPVTGGLSYRLSLAGTYSDNILYGSERQTVGGVGSVGGYHRTETLQGDRALEIGSEFSYRIRMGRLGSLTPYVNWSYGMVRRNGDCTMYGRGHMAGMTAGVRVNMRHLDLDLGYGKATGHSDYLRPRKDEFYFSGALKIVF